MIDENGIMTFDEFQSADEYSGDWDSGGMVTSYDGLFGGSALYSKDPTQVAASEYDILGGLTSLLRAGAPIAAAALQDAPASVQTYAQRIIPPSTTGAAVPQPMKTSPLLKAGLIVGGIVLGIVAIALGAKLLKG